MAEKAKAAVRGTKLQGDIEITRHLKVGGRAEVSGSAKIRHDLKVEGWLEAPNIKGAIKGFFPNFDALLAAYPMSSLQLGWMAAVGAGSPFTVYTVQKVGGYSAWVRTGGTLEISADMSRIGELSNEVEDLSGDVGTLEAQVETIEGALAETNRTISEESARIEGLVGAEAEARSNADEAETNARVEADNTLNRHIEREILERERVDTDLGGRIDAEASSRTAADEALETAIGQETTSREQGDTALGERIDAEASSRAAADEALAGRVATVEQAIADGVGTVKGVKLNGTEAPIDSEGIVHLTIDEQSADESLDPNSTRPIQNRAVASVLDGLDDRTVADIDVVEGDDSVTLRLLNKKSQAIAEAEIPAIGGGGGGDYQDSTRITLTASVDTNVVKLGEGAEVTYTYTAQDANGTDTGAPATIEVEVKNGAVTTMLKRTQNVGAGTYSVAIDEGLKTAGRHDVYVRAQAIDPITGATKKKQVYCQVYVSALTLTSDFSLTQVVAQGGLSGSTVSIPYTISGAGTKTVRLIVDGMQRQTQTQSSSGERRGEFDMVLTNLQPGRHSVQMVAEATIDGVTLTSESIYMDIVKQGMGSEYAVVKFSRRDGKVFTPQETPQILGGQYEPIEIEYAAYDPENEVASVDILVGSKRQATVLVPRKMQKHTMRFSDQGTKSVHFAVNSATTGLGRRTIGIAVASSTLGIEVSRASLAYELLAEGRSNGEEDPAQWENKIGEGGNIATFEGVDWNVSGWTGTSLKLNGGAKARLDMQPFAEQCERTGMTLIAVMRCSNIDNRSLPVLECMDEGKGISVTADTISYMTGQTVGYTDENGNEGTRAVGLSSNYEAGGWKSVAFVVRPPTSMGPNKDNEEQTARLMELYIDGENKGADIYGERFTFRQNTPKGILLDSTGADIEVRKLAMYNRALSDDELVDASILESETATEMRNRYEANDILNPETGKVDLSKLIAQGKGTVRIIVPNGGIDKVFAENDKKKQFLATVIYEPSTEQLRKGAQGFRFENVYISIQGTSSTKYAGKNVRIYMRLGENSRIWIGSTEMTGDDIAYSILPSVPGQIIIDLKADSSDSSMALNTGGAKLYNDGMIKCGLLTPPQRWQQEHGLPITARSAIYGTPVDLFASESEDGEMKYLGGYNLNNSKADTARLFGFEGVQTPDGTERYEPSESAVALEFLNNTDPACLWQAQLSGGTCFDWLNEHFDSGVEINYCKQGGDGNVLWTPTAKKPTVLSDSVKAAIERLFRFIAESVPEGADENDISTYESAYFRANAHYYLDINYWLTYYTVTNYELRVDQRVKNTIPVTFDGTTWYVIYYDGDTAEGGRNDIMIVYGYLTDRETWDSQAGKYAFEGHASNLWNLLLANFPAELASCAQRWREAVKIDDNVLPMYLGEQIGNWSERAYNKSGQAKYIEPAVKETYGSIWPFIYGAHGSRREQIEYMVRQRYAVLDAQYACGDYRNDNIDLYLSQGDGGMTSFLIEGYEPYAYGYGTNNQPLIDSTGVVAADTQAMLTIFGAYTINDPLRLYGASRMTKLDARGACSALKNGLDLKKCVKLRELDLSVPSGNTASTNWFFTSGSLRQLRRLNLKGQTNAMTGTLTSKEIDLSNSGRLEWLDCRDVDVLYVSLAPGAPITTAMLPSGLKSLVLESLPNLGGGLSLQSKADIEEIEIANCPGLADSHELVLSWLAQKSAPDSRCKLTLEGMEWTGVTAAQLLRVAQLGEYDLQGTVALTSTPTQAEASSLMEAFGTNVFSGRGRLKISAPGTFLIAAPSTVAEGFGEEDAVVARVFALDSRLENVQLEAASLASAESVGISVDEEAMTVTISAPENGTARSVTITVSGHIPGEMGRVSQTATVQITQRVYPSSYTVDAPTTLEAGHRYAVSLVPDTTEGVNGTWVTQWSITGSFAQYATLSGQTKDGCFVTISDDAEIGLLTIHADVYKAYASTAYTNAEKVGQCITDDVIMTSLSNPEAMAICHAQGWSANAEYMTMAEAEAVSDVGDAFWYKVCPSGVDLTYFGIKSFSERSPFFPTDTPFLKLPEKLLRIGRSGDPDSSLTGIYNGILSARSLYVGQNVSEIWGSLSSAQHGSQKCCLREVYFSNIIPPVAMSDPAKVIVRNLNFDYTGCVIYVPSQSGESYIATQYIQSAMSIGWTLSATL